MKIWFSAPIDCLDILKEDFKELKKYDLPCNIEEIFFSYDNPRCPACIAVTFYTKEDLEKGYPNVETNTKYFQMDSYERKLILLHEIIHTCQRVNDLNKINEKYFVRGINELEQIENLYIKTTGTSDPWIQTLNMRTKTIDMFASWIFEIWAEMYFKKQYPTHFQKIMEITYNIINSQYKRYAYPSDDDWSKFLVFAQLVRAYYMMKITQGWIVSSKYEELFENWRVELSECTKNGEYDSLMARLDLLCDISSFDKS